MKLRTAIATATTAAVLATSGVALAGAATNSTPHTATTTVAAAKPLAVKPLTPAAKARRIRIRLLIRRGAAKVITQTIGIDTPTLRKDLLAGETIAVIATDNHVDPATVIQNLETAATTKLTAAVKAGKIKAARATKIEAALPARVTKLVDTWLPKKAKTAAA